MIVVAIIGILAAVAIPAYTDYLKRSKVSEAVSLMGGTKTPIEDWLGSQGSWPSDMTSLGSKTSGKYTSSIILMDGTAANKMGVVATMKQGLGQIGLVYRTTSKDWACTILATTAADISDPVDNALAPSNCRVE
jgi:type IV pilus assembly protein PilA